MNKPASLDGDTQQDVFERNHAKIQELVARIKDLGEPELAAGEAAKLDLSVSIVQPGQLLPDPLAVAQYEMESARAELAEVGAQLADALGDQFKLRNEAEALRGQVDAQAETIRTQAGRLEEADALLSDPIVERAVELVEAINARDSEQDDIDDQLEAARQALERRGKGLEEKEQQLANREKAVEQTRRLAADRKAQIEALVKANEELEARRREAKTAATAAAKRSAELESVVGRLVAEKALLQEQLDGQAGPEGGAE